MSARSLTGIWLMTLALGCGPDADGRPSPSQPPSTQVNSSAAPSAAKGGGQASMLTGDAQQGRQIALKKCWVCHDVEDKKSLTKQAEPLKDVVPKRVEKMQNYTNYALQLRSKNPQLYQANQAVLSAIVSEKNSDTQLQRWFVAYLKNPTFDDAGNTMAVQILSPDEMQHLAAYLMTQR
ncbi:MAG: c-type cytochrome [Planctomycetota bacterium]